MQHDTNNQIENQETAGLTAKVTCPNCNETVEVVFESYQRWTHSRANCTACGYGAPVMITSRYGSGEHLQIIKSCPLPRPNDWVPIQFDSDAGKILLTVKCLAVLEVESITPERNAIYPLAYLWKGKEGGYAVAIQKGDSFENSFFHLDGREIVSKLFLNWFGRSPDDEGALDQIFAPEIGLLWHVTQLDKDFAADVRILGMERYRPSEGR